LGLIGYGLFAGAFLLSPALHADSPSTGAATIQAGLSSQGQGKFVLDADRLYGHGPQVAGMSGWVEDPGFLGPGASLTLEVQTWQLWLYLHPEATKLAQIPTDRPSHENLAASVEVTFRKAGAVVSRQTLVTYVDEAFSARQSCRRGCGPEKMVPASLTRQTPPFTIPGGTDEIDATWKAVDVSTQQTTDAIVSIRRTFLPPDKVHAFAVSLDHAGPGTFRILDGEGLVADKPTEFIYNSKATFDYAYDDESDQSSDGGWIEVCHNAATGEGFSEPTSTGYADVWARYRFDDGAWSDDVPTTETFPDIASALMLPILGDSSGNGYQAQGGFTLPAGTGHQHVDIAFKIQSWMGPRGVLDCASLAGPGYVSNYPQGIWPTVHTTWNSPTSDDSSGWRFELK
jgi:hypothetical protein